MLLVEPEVAGDERDEVGRVELLKGEASVAPVPRKEWRGVRRNLDEVVFEVDELEEIVVLDEREDEPLFVLRDKRSQAHPPPHARGTHFEELTGGVVVRALVLVEVVELELDELELDELQGRAFVSNLGGNILGGRRLTKLAAEWSAHHSCRSTKNSLK